MRNDYIYKYIRNYEDVILELEFEKGSLLMEGEAAIGDVGFSDEVIVLPLGWAIGMDDNEGISWKENYLCELNILWA